MARITDKQLSNLKAGVWLSESLGKGNGTFLARRTGETLTFYYRYTTTEGKRDTLRFGTYGQGQLSLKEGREEALRLSNLYREHPHLRAWLEEQEHLESEALRRERNEREHCTLAALLEGYAAWLEQQGKFSAKQVRGAINRHVLEAWPDLAASKATGISKRDLSKIISKVVEAGKGREAGKLRSYLRAAFAAALRAESDPSIPPGLQGFNLETNPAADLAPLSQFNKARNTALSLPELRAVWQRMQTLGGATGAALRLCLLLGGQRPTQLLRIKTTDIDFHAGTITLADPKGRRTQAREHVLPISEKVRGELEPWAALHAGGYVLSSTGGKVPLRQETLSNSFREDIAKPLLEAGEISQEIRLADLRRTVETRLSSLKVSKETRAQLQSHGLGGVQNRHYDMHEYMDEKRNALMTLEKLLSEHAGNVVVLPLRARAGT